MANFTETVSEKAKDIGNKSAEQMRKSMETGQNAAENVLDRAKEMGSNAINAVEAKADDVTGAISRGLKSTARAIRENGPTDSSFGPATSAVAQTFSNSASYLDEQGARGIIGDLSNLIGKNPIPALLMGIGLGCLLALAPRRS